MTTADRRDLVKGLWPDKALYGATMLFIAAVLGTLYGLAVLLFQPTLSTELPGFIRDYPPMATILFSLVAAIFAGVSLARRSTRPALVGCAAGVLSLGLVGLASVFALIAGVFVYLSRAEGEDRATETQELSAELWPDKALAASVVLTVTGVITVAWGLALARGALQFSGYTSDPASFGWVALAAGLLALVAAAFVYRQRGLMLGVAAALANVATLGLYVLAPLLALAALTLLFLAWREDEFGAPLGHTTSGTRAGP